MKLAPRFALVFLAGLALGILVSPLRWEFTAGNIGPFRFDRLTGRAWSGFGGEWRQIAEP